MVSVGSKEFRNSLRDFRAHSIPETMDASFFPITIQWKDTMKEEVISDPNDLPKGREFRVIKIRDLDGNDRAAPDPWP